MRVLIPSTNDNLDSIIDTRFFHAAYYIIYDGNEYEVIANNINHTHHHKRDIDWSKIDALIINNIGIEAYKEIKNFNVNIYHSNKTPISSAFKMFYDGALKEISEKEILNLAHKGVKPTQKNSVKEKKLKARDFIKNKSHLGRGSGLGKRHH